MEPKFYGVVTLRDGSLLNTGYTLAQVEELARDMDECEMDMYELTGDLAVCPKLIRDLVARIRELESELVSQNVKTEA